jgi:hypothetical protein
MDDSSLGVPASPSGSTLQHPSDASASIPNAVERDLFVAAGQASFALRTLLPDDPDAQMTVRMLERAMAKSQWRAG